MSANPAPNAAISPWSATAHASSATPAAARRGAAETSALHDGRGRPAWLKWDLLLTAPHFAVELLLA
jgi:hypothetical protein